MCLMFIRRKEAEGIDEVYPSSSILSDFGLGNTPGLGGTCEDFVPPDPSSSEEGTPNAYFSAGEVESDKEEPNHSVVINIGSSSSSSRSNTVPTIVSTRRSTRTRSVNPKYFSKDFVN